MDKVECFKIQIIRTEDLFDITKGIPIKQIDCEPNVFVKEPKIIEADPFLFVKSNILYLFFEDKKMYKPGVISMVCTRDMIHWTDPVVVLSEKCHLSYPWVFEDKGHVYMIPETCALNSIRLYEANEELNDFKYIKTLLYEENVHKNGFSYSDSSIYKKDGIYYLMTTINDKQNNILKLFVSDNLMDGYKEHPKSPISAGNKYGRNAGCLFMYQGNLYRVAQDCEKKYGDNIHILQVKIMNKREYKEEVLKENIIPKQMKFYKEGGHQFNFVKFHNKYIVATDAKEYHYFILQKILHKLKCYK